MKKALSLLKERGFFQQCTNEEGLDHLLAQGSLTFYIGIDPTGPSCHIGHLVPIYAAAHLQKVGHIPIILMGGGTALIGDPSGKTKMRKMIDPEVISRNIGAMKPQLGRLIDFSHPSAISANNADWLTPLSFIDFLRDTGRCFSVNRMLTFEAYRQRMERGLSFLEFSYQLLQAYDFLELYRRHNCLLQIGGDDQWGNIVAGIDLIRRMEGKTAYGLTFPLITRSDGKKMGKTEQGALFLDSALTPVYDFYQYWRNVPDEDVSRFLLLFTFLETEECYSLGSAKNINASKERLAFEVTKLLHSEAEAETAQAATKAMFQGGSDRQGMPTTDIASAKLEEGISVAELFTLTGLCSSRSEARRLIQQGGARINDDKVTDTDATVNSGMLENGEIILKAGKKHFHRVRAS